MSKKIYIEIVGGKSFTDEIGRQLYSGNIKLHGKHPIDRTPIPCFAKLEENGEVPILTRRIVGIEIDNKNIVRKITEDGFPDQTTEGFAFPISSEVLFNDLKDLNWYAVIGKPMPKIPNLE